MLTFKFKGSSFIAGVKFNPETKVVDVKFKSGKRYRYREFSKQKLTRWLNADSKGSYYATKVKGKHPMRRLTTLNAEDAI